MCEKLAQLGKPCFQAEIRVAENSPDAGMYGSGVFVLNPPWQLDMQLENALDCVVSRLSSVDEGINASARVTWVVEDS